MIKAIAFDYGGVIEIEEDLYQKIADYLGISRKDWSNTYYTFNYLNNTGLATLREVFALVAKKFNATEDQINHIYKIVEENSKTRKINFGLLEIIKDLKNRNYKIGFISNYGINLRQKMTNQGIIDYFDVVIVSAEVGYQKPQPEIFEILFQKLGVKNNEVAFVDDSEQSLLGAEAIGYVPILYINNEKLKEKLTELGLI